MSRTASKISAQVPDENGMFGEYGGRYVAETLIEPLAQLEQAYLKYKNNPKFLTELDTDLAHYVGRPSPLYHAKRLSQKYAGAQIYLKREDLNHTGAHKINNTIGQALLAKRMGKTRIIAETGAGQHGVAAATVAARLGLECVVYMGKEDIQRQAPNVYRMRLLGAGVVPVTSGSKTLKDALNEALRDWVTNVDSTFYIIGSVAGPHPYPLLVRDFQSIIGREAKAQLYEMTGCLPDALVACVGGGSNAIGLFYQSVCFKRMGGFTWRVCKTSSEVDNHAVRLASVESVCSNVGITLKDLSILIRNRGSLCGVIYLNLEAFHRLGRL